MRTIRNKASIVPAMHAPDGFLNAGAAVATGGLSAGAVGASLRYARRRLGDRHLPLAGITAAFIFAAQMVNFPVAAGTSGHLLGGTLAAVLLGPPLGAVAMTVVVAVQALVFADGGLTALGYNILNLAVVPVFGGYAAFRLFLRMLPAGRSGAAAAAGLAGLASVLLSAMAFSLEWLFGASAPIPFDRVFGAVVGVHVLVGAGEAVITGLATGAVLAARPDLVFGTRDLDLGSLETSGARRPVRGRTAVIAAMLIALVTAGAVSQFASDAPDGLERAAAELGISGREAPDWLPAADYAVRGINNPALSLAAAGAAGVLIVSAVAAGAALAVRGGPGGSPGSTVPRGSVSSDADGRGGS